MSAAPDFARGAWDRATLDREYSPSSCVPSLQVYLDDYEVKSEEARRAFPHVENLRYGQHPDETLDFFPAGPGAPLHVFVHGGNWQALSKNCSAFPAPGFVRAGSAFAAVNYGLAPACSLDEMIAMIRRCISWLWTRADALGFDARRLHVSGVSAGAHLVAMALLAKTEAEEPVAPVAGVTLMSGIYDLEPLRHSYVNDVLKLEDAAMSERLSPLHQLRERLPPIVLSRGGNETSEFLRQHLQMRERLEGRCELTEALTPARNHFDLTYDLGVAGTPLGDAVRAQMGLRTGGLP